MSALSPIFAASSLPTALDILKSAYENEIFQDPVRFLTHGHPLAVTFVVMVAVSLICLVLSEITGHLSYVDKLWSLLPEIYALCFLHSDYRTSPNGHLNPRLILMTVLPLLWGTRLTFNFARKGGYSMEEDYRWPYLRNVLPRFVLSLLDLFFISTWQNVLLFLIILPIHVAYQTRHLVPHLNEFDYLAVALFLLLLLGETVADQQQWNFQNEKYRRINAKQPLIGDYKRGFLTSGLFSLSRHPNFFCEISIWWVYYLFSLACLQPSSNHDLNAIESGFYKGGWINWTMSGCFFLLLLFQGSTWLTELITAKKYPDYKVYQKRVSRLIPWLPSSSPSKSD